MFRTDLISAMKVPDYHVLSPETYITITDQWRQEWERGVQVGVAAASKQLVRALLKSSFVVRKCFVQYCRSNYTFKLHHMYLEISY